MRSVTHSTGAAVVGPGTAAAAASGKSAGEEPRVGEEVARRRSQAGASCRPRERRREAHDELVEAQRLPGEDLRELRASVPAMPSARRWSPGTVETLRATMPPGASRCRQSRKNSRVAR